jgi:Arc/MetJ-type ribon-helix-helix transcriptional regulator
MGRYASYEKKKQTSIQMPQEMFEKADKRKDSLRLTSVAEYIRNLIQKDLESQNQEAEQETTEEPTIEEAIEPEVIEKPVDPLIEECKNEIISKLTEYLKNYTFTKGFVAFSVVGLDSKFAYKTLNTFPKINYEFEKFNIVLEIGSGFETDIIIMSSDNFNEFKKSQGILIIK